MTVMKADGSVVASILKQKYEIFDYFAPNYFVLEYEIKEVCFISEV